MFLNTPARVDDPVLWAFMYLQASGAASVYQASAGAWERVMFKTHQKLVGKGVTGAAAQFGCTCAACGNTSLSLCSFHRCVQFEHMSVHAKVKVASSVGQNACLREARVLPARVTKENRGGKRCGSVVGVMCSHATTTGCPK